MNTLRNIIVTLTLVTVAATGTALAHASGDNERGHRSDDRSARVDRRQDRQLARIWWGGRSGALTRNEARRLKHQQRTIAGMEHRFESDGHYRSRHGCWW